MRKEKLVTFMHLDATTAAVFENLFSKFVTKASFYLQLLAVFAGD